MLLTLEVLEATFSQMPNLLPTPMPCRRRCLADADALPMPCRRLLPMPMQELLPMHDFPAKNRTFASELSRQRVYRNFQFWGHATSNSDHAVTKCVLLGADACCRCCNTDAATPMPTFPAKNRTFDVGRCGCRCAIFPLGTSASKSRNLSATRRGQ